MARVPVCKVVEALGGVRDLPCSASSLGTVLDIPGAHETRRRRVRELMETARETGHRVCANGEGYWLARSDAEWAAYTQARKSGARFEFVRLRRMATAATEAANRQGRLFEESKGLGWAAMA